MHHHSILQQLALLTLIANLAGCGSGGGPADPALEIKAADPAPTLPPPRWAAGDWPVWRGPQGGGHCSDAEIPLQWSETQNVLWTANVPGRGHSSPIVVGDLVLLASALKDTQEQVVIAFDRASGEQRWQRTIHQGGFEENIHQKGTQANSTLASDGERIFAAFLNNQAIHVTALDLNGEQLWQQEAGGFDSMFGYAPSPTVYQDCVIIAADNQGGGFLAALRRDTGEFAWRRPRPAVSTYSSPRIASIGGRDQLIISGCSQLASYDPATGEENWSVSALAAATCGTIVTDGERIFASGGYSKKETACVSSDGQVLWRNKTKHYEPSLALVGDYLYGVDDNGVARCWDKASGEEQWKSRLGGDYSASPIVCGKHIFASNLSGETVVFEATPESLTEVARNQLGDDTYASLAVSSGQIFIRAGHGRDSQRQERLHCIRRKTEQE